MSRFLFKSLLLILALAIYSKGIAQISTEIYLFDLTSENGEFNISNPRNISNNEGYDNQPSFLNNEEFVYSSTFDNQTDIVKYNISNKEKTRISNTAASEYSPKLTPGGKYISAVIQNQDGSQILAKYPIKGGEPKLIPSHQKIGYYCWYDKKTIFAFVLGEPPSLQQWNTKNAEFKVIMMQPGRSLNQVPNKKSISFIHKESDEIWYLNSYDPLTDKVEYIAESMPGAEDLTWSSDGTIFLSKDKNIYKYNPANDTDWKLMASMEKFNLSNATRLAVSPDGKMMTVVIDE